MFSKRKKGSPGSNSEALNHCLGAQGAQGGEEKRVRLEWEHKGEMLEDVRHSSPVSPVLEGDRIDQPSSMCLVYNLRMTMRRAGAEAMLRKELHYAHHERRPWGLGDLCIVNP